MKKVLIVLMIMGLFVVSCSFQKKEADTPKKDIIEGPNPVIEPQKASLPEAVDDNEDAEQNETREILVRDDEFFPSRVRVKVGEKVIFKNIRESTGSKKVLIYGVRACRELKSPQFDAGEEFTHVFTEPMTCDYIDAIRTKAKPGTIIVEG